MIFRSKNLDSSVFDGTGVTLPVGRLSGKSLNTYIPYVAPSSEKAMAPHSSVLAWRIPGMGEPGGLPSVGLHRVGHD